MSSIEIRERSKDRQEEKQGAKYCSPLREKLNLIPIMMLPKKNGYSPKATHQCCPLSSLGFLRSCTESRVADHSDGIKYVFYSLSPLLAFGTTE